MCGIRLIDGLEVIKTKPCRNIEIGYIFILWFINSISNRPKFSFNIFVVIVGAVNNHLENIQTKYFYSLFSEYLELPILIAEKGLH